jgi:hypothetical protein
LFKWLNLIFFKTHLKDRKLRFHLDSREGSEKIADFYYWEELHHIHCIARSFYTGARLDPTVLGSFLIFPAKTGTPFGDFDYRDMYAGRTVLLRLGEIGLLSVLNDSCAAWNLLKGDLQRIGGPLSPSQFKELFARMAFINLHLKQRPVPASSFSAEGCDYVILADVPEVVELEKAESTEFGRLLYWCCEDIIRALPSGDQERISHHIKEGTLSFLFDGDGKFVNNAL